MAHRVGDFARAFGRAVQRGVNDSAIDALPQYGGRKGDQRLDDAGGIEFVDVIFIEDGVIEAAKFGSDLCGKFRAAVIQLPRQQEA